MKKLRNVILFTIYLLLSSSFVNAQESNNPKNINLDLSSFSRNISLNADNEEGAYSCTINVKFKKNVPLKDDTITVFLKFAANFSCEKLKYEFLSDDKIISSDFINNTTSKSKAFDSSAVIPVKTDIGTSNKIKLTFNGITEKKPWIQLKEAKIPKEPKVEKEAKPAKESKEKAEKKSKKEKKVEESESKETTENIQAESQVSETLSEDSPEPESEDESINNIIEKEETNSENQNPENQEEETQNISKEKKQKGNFLTWLKSLFTKKNKKLPKEVQTYVETMETNQNSLFINSMNKKKNLSQITGPFNTNEQVILVWIYKELPENNKYAISNNEKYVTDSPSVFFANIYKEVSDYIAVNGMEEAFKKYFSSDSKKDETLPVTSETSDESEKIKQIEPEKTEEKVETKLEESLPETEPAPVIDETPFFELPLNNDLSSNSNYSSYKKEYLQDYAPKKKLELPKESISEKTIDNPDESDTFGRTLLMKAAQNGNNWEIKSLLASGADVNLKDNDGWTALMYAIRYQQNISIVETLINAGATIKVKNKYDLSPLILAASYNGNPEITKKILSYYSVSEKEVLQAFVLMLSDNSSSDFAKLAKIDEFLYKSIPLNTFYNGKTPLMYAAQYSDSTKILNSLMEAGAITSIRSTEGKTAFDYAQENKLLEHDDYYWALNRK